MEIHTTATFDELFLKLPRKIQTKADEKTKLFRGNPFNRKSTALALVSLRTCVRTTHVSRI